MRKIIFIEGLPGVGKTTLVNAIKKRNIPNVTIIDEIINEKITKENIYTEDEFINNDIQKIESITDGIVILDRGILSSLSYSQAKAIIDLSFDVSKARTLFSKYKNILENSKVYYLTNNMKYISITSSIENSPYGTISNQELLEHISLYNIKRYCKDYVIREYYKDDMEGLIDEIIN